MRVERRAELARDFVRVLGARGRGGATIEALAAEAGVAPGLVHHYFKDKHDLWTTALDALVIDFHARAGRTLDEYLDAALALGERSDVVAARAWVAIFAEAHDDPALFAKVRRVLDVEITHIEKRAKSRAGGALDERGASAMLSFVLGALVFGSFAPRRAAGFAHGASKRLLRALSHDA